MLPLLVLGVALAGPVPTAIERSVQERMGDVRVAVIEISGGIRSDGATVRRCDGAGRKVLGSERCKSGRSTATGAQSREANLLAVPEPGSRLGNAIRFILFADGQRVGSVVVELAVTGEITRARKAIARGKAVAAGDIEIAEVELKDVLLRRLPAATQVEGSEARRDIRAGEVLTDAVLSVPPVVQSGDEVNVTVVAGPVTVTGRGHASGSGRTGDFIRVLLPSRRKGLKARITGPGSVELVR